jgi:hypothetical protein
MLVPTYGSPSRLANTYTRADACFMPVLRRAQSRSWPSRRSLSRAAARSVSGTMRRAFRLFPSRTRTKGKTIGCTLDTDGTAKLGPDCTGWQGPEWVHAYRRWSLRLKFSLLSDVIEVSAFFNMGSNERRPQIGGCRSRFYAAWCMANGETPRKGQEMSLDTFTDPGLIYLVRVKNAQIDGKSNMKPDALVYSRVTEILCVQRK